MTLKEKKKCEEEAKCQLLHLLFLETESKSTTLCGFFYMQIYIMNHVSVMRFCAAAKSCFVVSTFTAPEETCKKTRLFTPALKMLTLCYFLTQAGSGRCEGHQLHSLFTLLNFIFQVNSALFALFE